MKMTGINFLHKPLLSKQCALPLIIPCYSMLSGDCSSPLPLSLHSDSLSAQITATKTLNKDFGVFFSPCSCEESYTNPAITSCSISAQFCVKPSITNVLLSSSPGALLTGIQSQITPGFQSSSSFPLTTSMQMLYTCWMHRYSHISALIVSTWNNSWHLVSIIFK